jgi:hypothetical protein
VLSGQDAILANNQTYTCSPALHNRIEIDGNGNGATVTVLANLTPVTAVLGGNSTANVGNGSLSGIGATVYLENPPAHNVVNIDDHNDSAAHTATIGTFPTGQSTGYLAGVSPGIIEWVSLDTDHVNIALGAGTSTVNVEGVSVPTFVSNRATATVNVGSGGRLSGILSPLFLENPPSFDTVNIFDQNDFAAHTATIRNPGSFNELTGVSPGVIRWVSADTSQANIHLGPGTSTVNVQGIGVPTTVFNQAPATVNVGFNGSLFAIQGTLLLENEPSFDTVNIDDRNDSAGHTATISTVTRPGDTSLGQLAGVSPGVIQWDYFDTSQASIALGAGTSTVNVQGIGVPTTVFNQALATVNVGLNGSVSGILRTLLLENEPSYDTVNIFDQNDLAAHTATISTVTRPGDTSLGQLGGVSPGVIQWDYFDTRAVNIYFGTGTSAVNVLGTGVPTTIFNQAPATVNVGSGGSLQGILGPLSVENPSSFTALNVDDENDPASRTVFLINFTPAGDTEWGSILGLTPFPIDFECQDMSGVDVTTGTGAVTVNVLSTCPLGLGGTLTVLNNSNSTVNVGNAGRVQAIRGPLMVANHPGYTTLNVDDSSDPTPQNVTLDNPVATLGTISGLAPAVISFYYDDLTAVNISGGSGGNVFDIERIGVATTINAGAAGDCFHVSPTAQWLGANILAPLTLNGSGTGADVLDFFDSNDPNPETFSFDAVPSMLTLGSTPDFLCTFSGFAPGSIYVLTNGMSTPDDASGTVVFDPDEGPPCVPTAGAGGGGADALARAQALAEAVAAHSRTSALAPPVSDAMAVDLHKQAGNEPGSHAAVEAALAEVLQALAAGPQWAKA